MRPLTIRLLREAAAPGKCANPWKQLFIGVTLCVSVCTGRLSAQAPAKVDFAKDVMPLFRQNCIECHGAKKQQNGLRLDRKSSVRKLFSRRSYPAAVPTAWFITG